MGKLCWEITGSVKGFVKPQRRLSVISFHEHISLKLRQFWRYSMRILKKTYRCINNMAK